MQRFFLTISALMVIFTAGAAAAQTGGSVASFAPLADNVRYQRTSNPVLPGNVSAVLDDGTSAQIPVTWAADGYNGFGTVTGLYVFHASVDTARAPLMAPLRGVDPPKITVMLLPLFVPAMAGIGDAASPLQVINAAQLAEIAEMVNAGMLETFITGNPNTQVHFRMTRDISLSAYGKDAWFNGGKGWAPIGTSSNPFKSIFDGNNRTITGLFIDDNTLGANAGLFGRVAGTGIVRDVRLHDPDVNGNIVAEAIGNAAGSVAAGGQVINCQVTFTPKTVTGISIITHPANLTYTHGQTLNLAGLSVRLTFDDLSTGDAAFANFASRNITAAPANNTALVRSTHNNTAVTVIYNNSLTIRANTNNLTVNRANPAVTWPANLTAVFGDTRGNVSLPGNGSAVGVTGANLPGTFTWTDGNTGVVGSVGTPVHSITFTPNDTANYNALTHNVTITVSPRIITAAAVTVTSPVKSAVPNTTAGGTGNFTVGAVSWSPSDAAFLGSTRYTAAVTLTANANYTFTGGLTTATIDGYSAVVTNNTGSTVILSYQFAPTSEKDIADIAIHTQPANLTYTHGQTLNLTGLAVTINYSDLTSENVNYVDFASKNLYANPANNTALVRSTHNGNPVTVSLGSFSANTTNLTVNPATPTVAAVPTASDVITGAALSASALSGGVVNGLDNQPIAGNWAWTDGAQIVNATESFAAIFTPTSTNYNPVTANVSVTAVPPPVVGSGTSADPFQITNEDQLRRVGRGAANPAEFGGWTLSAHYRLMANITLDAANPNNWTPIGTFTGNFDGGGHTITGLNVNGTGVQQGMFSSNNGGTIRNLALTGGRVVGTERVGAIVGWHQTGIVENVFSSNSVSGTRYVGGIVGDNGNGRLQFSFSTGAVGGNSEVGGIAGVSSGGGTVLNCVALNSSITRSSGTNTLFGRVIGWNNNTTLTNNRAYYGILINGNFVTNGAANNLNGADFSIEQIAQQQSWTGFLFGGDNPWVWEDGKLPRLKNSPAADFPDWLADVSTVTVRRNSEAPLGYINLAAALASITTAGDYTVTLRENQTMAANRTIAAGQNITFVVSTPACTITLTANNQVMFTLNGANAALTLGGNITLVGFNGTSNQSLINITNGTLTMLDGSMITRHTTSNAAGAAVVINGANARFNMTGGTITGNRTTAVAANTAANAGVTVTNGMFEMTGGSITGNRHGPVADGDNSPFADVYLGATTAAAANIVPTFNGNAQIGSLKLLAQSGAINTRINIGDNFTGNIGGLHLRGNIAAMATAISWWENRQVISAAANYTLTSGDVERITLRNFLSTETSQPISSMHFITDLGRFVVRSPFTNGSGTTGDPFLVTQANIAQFNTYVNTATGLAQHYRLMENIVLDPPAPPLASNWTAIGAANGATVLSSFSGSFDGGGHTITGLNIDAGTVDAQGMFGVSDGRIMNLALAGGSITGANRVGSIVGWMRAGTLENCFSSNSVTGNNEVGGIGGGTNGMVRYNFSTGAVSGVTNVGGVVGSSSGAGTVLNCIALNSSITRRSGTAGSFGRITGWNNATTLTNNRAYYGILINGNFVINGAASANINGADFRVEQIAQQQNWTGFLFGGDNPWVWEDGRLPRLKNSPEADFPDWLADISTVTVSINSGAPLGYVNLAAALASITTAGNYTVTLRENQTIAANRTIAAGQNITFACSTPACTITLTANNQVMFTLNGANAALTLGENITLRGHSASSANLISVTNGALTMENGSKITGHTTSGANGVIHINGGTLDMRGGEISGNASTNAGAAAAGGVRVQLGAVTLGGSSKISDNTRNGVQSNLILENNVYAAFGTGDNAPAADMEIWVTKTANNGVITQSGAAAEHLAYMRSDNPARSVLFINDQLRIVDDGSADNPFIIAGEDDLRAVGRGTYNGKNWSLSAHYKLTKDIDLDPPAPPLASNWTAIGIYVSRTDLSQSFTGVFDGNGHTVTGLTVDNPTAGYQGMFGVVGGSGSAVRNLILADVSINGEAAVGGIAGQLLGGTVENSAVLSGTVTGHTNVGGIVGDNNWSTVVLPSVVRNCFSGAAVTGTGEGPNGTMAGGIAGHNSNGSTVENSYAAGSVTGISNVGGVVGLNRDNGGPIRNNAALNQSVTGTVNVGRVLGGSIDNSVPPANNYAFAFMDINLDGVPKTVISNADGIDGLSVSAADLKTRTIWENSANFTFGTAATAPWVWTNDKMPRLYFETTAQDWPVWFVDPPVTVSTDNGAAVPYGTLQEAMSDIVTVPGNHLITLNAGQDLTNTLFGTAGVSVTLIGAGGQMQTITHTGTAAQTMFSLNAAGATLTLENNITLQGRAAQNSTVNLIHIQNGEVKMQGSSVITGHSTSMTEAAVRIDGVNARFIMEDGAAVTANISTQTNGSTASTGGVYLSNGVFTMRGDSRVVQNLGNSTNPRDLYIGSGGVFTLEDNAQIGHAVLNGVFEGGNYARINVASGWTGSAVMLNMRLDSDNMTAIKAFWEDRQVLQGAVNSGAAAKFPLGNFVNTLGTVAAEQISATHFIDDAGFLRSSEEGTQARPFLITDETQLRQVGSGTNGWTLSAYYRLMDDIDLTGKDVWVQIGSHTNPAEPFTGNFDGNNYTIKGLTITGWASFTGMFGSITGVVSNLILEDVNISGSDYVGGIVGVLEGSGRVVNCRVSGVVGAAGSNYVGGIAGTVNPANTIIENSYSSAAIQGVETLGCIAGNNIGTIRNCYASCSVTGNTNIGGIAGANAVWGGGVGVIENSCAAGNISGNSNVGGIAGRNDGGSTVSNSAALNAVLTRSSGVNENVGRVTGINAGTLNNNYARSDMAFVNVLPTLNAAQNGKDGASITSTQWESESWWRGTAQFTDSWWDDKLPPSVPAIPGFDVTVNSGSVTAGFENLTAALNSITAAGTYEVTLKENQTLTAAHAFSVSGANITISSEGAAPVTIIRGVTGDLFSINSGAALTLQNVIIDGNRAAYPITHNGTLVKVNTGGTFTMNAGAILQNNRNSETADANTGGAVHVSAGTFIMNGGEVRDNIGYNGGGVYVKETAGTFTMNDGKIINNNSSSTGGGLHVFRGSFTMVDGEISGNTSPKGGGILTVYGASINMSGGKISGNTASANFGGGIFIESNTSPFTMTGGEISGNTAVTNGGGVYVDNVGSNITIGGTAVIKSNTRGAAVNNLYLIDGRYITIGTAANAPAAGMEVWTQTATATGVIVNANAVSGHEAFFRSDVADKGVIFDSPRLVLADFGIAPNPFLVTNEEDLRRVGTGANGWSLSAYYRMTADIELMQDWQPIGYNSGNLTAQKFTGTFDGGGYSISGMKYVNTEDVSFWGMFRSVGAFGVVQNFQLVNVEIQGRRTVGGVAGDNGGTVRNVSVSGSVRGSSDGTRVGGIVGENLNGGMVENCFSAAVVGGGAGNTGGIVGDNKDGGTVRNCVALNPSVEKTNPGNPDLGRVIGLVGTGSVMANNFAFAGMTLNGTPTNSDVSNSRDGADLSALQIKTQQAWETAGFDFSAAGPWQWNGTDGMPSHKGAAAPLPWPNFLVDNVTVTANGVTAGFGNLTAALNSITDAGTYVVTIKNSETIAPYAFTANAAIPRDITLTAQSGEEVTVQLASNGSLFTVSDGVTLRIGSGVTLHGRNETQHGADNSTSLVMVNSGGALHLNCGAKITGNTVSSNSSGGGGFGVRVEANGTFTMTGGEISANADLTVSGDGGAIMVRGIFNMSGGVISDNTTAYTFGGGVFVSPSGTFNMSGGTIRDNIANSSFGSGVTVRGRFVISGGEITGNTAANSISSDVHGYRDIAAPLSISGTAKIGTLLLSAQNETAVFPSIGAGDVSSVGIGRLNLQGDVSDMQTAISLWEGKQVLTAAAGHTLSAGDVAKFPLGNFISFAAADNTQPISQTHFLASSGADIGKLLALGTAVTVSTNGGVPVPFENLEEAFNSIITNSFGSMVPGDHTITLNANQTIGTIPMSFDNSSITLIGADVERIIEYNGDFNKVMFEIHEGDYEHGLTLGNNITLKGVDNGSTSPLIWKENGTFLTMEQGSKITGHNSNNAALLSYGTVIINGGEISENTGGGVYGKNVIINGGKVINNTQAGSNTADVKFSVGSLTLSGSPQIGVVSLLSFGGSGSFIDTIFIESAFTGRVDELNLAGYDADMTATKARWEGIQVLQAADGYALTGQDVANFALVNFVAVSISSDNITQPIAPDYTIVNSGANIGRLLMSNQSGASVFVSGNGSETGFSSLTGAFNSITAPGDYTVTVKENPTLVNNTLRVPDANITLTGEGAGEYTLQHASAVNTVMFGIHNANARLTLSGNITLRGIPNGTTALVSLTNGRLIMQTGSKITGHTNSSTLTVGAVNMNGANARLVMNGGEITGNTSTVAVTNTGVTGGVRLENGFIEMNGGKIHGNLHNSVGADVYVSAAAADRLTLSGNAEIGALKLNAAAAFADVAINGGFTGSIGELSLRGNNTDMATAVSFWNDKQVLTGAGVTQALVNSITLRNFMSSATNNNTQPIAQTHSISESGVLLVLGTAQNPFLVATEDDLRAVGRGAYAARNNQNWSLSAHYRMTANITMQQGDWTPIGASGAGNQFTGGFDGGGFVISGMNVSGDSRQGFIGVMSAGGVRNLGIRGSVSGVNQIGGIVGENNGGFIANAFFDGSVTGMGLYVGGIVGQNVSGMVEFCYAMGTVSGTNAGGIAGLTNGNDGSKIENSVALQTSVSGGSSRRISGIVTASPFNDNYVRPDMLVDGVPLSFSDAGSNHGADITDANIDNVQAMLDDVFKDNAPILSELLGIQPMMALIPFDFMSAPDQWLNCGAVGAPCVITTAEELAGLALFTNDGNDTKDKNYVLGNDIDLSKYYTAWTPIGTSVNPFKGNFDGADFTINAININNNNLNNAGLFGVVDGGKIENLGITGTVGITGNENAGAIAGMIIGGGVVDNCYSTVSVFGANRVGGLVGLLGDGAITNSASLARIVGGNVVETGHALSLLQSQSVQMGRIVGTVTNAVLSQNRAFARMLDGVNGDTLSWTHKTHDGKDGANINSAEEFFENGGAPIYTKLRNMAFVNVENNVTRTYNGTQITPVVTWGTGPSAEPLVNGRDYTITFVDAPARPYAAPGTDAGAGTFTITGIGNYTGTTTARNFTITKKPITVTVTPGQTKIFGEDDPAAFIYTYIPALLGDDRFTGLLNRTPGEDAGSYRINQNTLTVNNNYEIIFISADFVITRAPQLEKPDTARTFTDTAKIASGVPGISVVVNESGTVSYTVDAGNRLEYCIANCEDDNNWVADLDLSSLRPNMEYGIFVRIQGTENYEPSEPEVIRFRTMTEGVSIKESDRNVPTVSTDGFGADDSGKASDSRYGLVINQRIVTQKAEFSVTAPGKASAAIIVYDNLGKIVFKSKNVRSGQPVSWNLINRQGRAAGSGSYLVIAVVRDANGKTYRYSEQVYVRR